MSGCRKPPADINRSIKALVSRVHTAFLRLENVEVDPARVRLGDVSVNVLEHRADQVLIVGEEDDPVRWDAHVEYQLQPSPDVLAGWFFKNAALTAHLKRPVILIGLYLERGSRATFPDAYVADGGGLTNEYRFYTLRLWEHPDRIRSGELQALAPLLLLAENEKSERIMREELALIRRLDVPLQAMADLLAVAFMVGTRCFPRDLLEGLFREEWTMMKEATLIDEWIQEGIEKGIAQGMEQGRAQGIEQGRREILLHVLREKFGELPEQVVARVQAEGCEWCEELVGRALRASSLDELGL